MYRSKIISFFKRSLFFFFLFISIDKLSAQDDLLKVLQSEAIPEKENVIATFKGNKIINIETNETVRKKNLDFRVSHLFGNIGKESGGGIHNFYGFDQSSDIRIAFHFGLTNRLMAGVSHVKRNENFEGLLKFRLLEQTTDNNIPLSVTLFGNTTYSVKSADVILKNIHRYTYCSEIIFARKFSSDFSFALIPSYVHRNFVTADDVNNTFSISGGLRYKFTRSAAIITDYCHTFGRKNLLLIHYDVMGAGIEIETGGHVFSIMFSNAGGTIENDYLVNTTDSWGKGGMKFSFIISRMFPMGKDK